MRRWSWWEPAPKQPVPEDGLQVDRFGQTWWGQHWIRALNRLGRSYTNRLPRGRSYARAGRVVDLAMGAGEATAGVVGTRRKPYSVHIKLKTFSRQSWQKIVGVIASRACFSVALLRGEIPPEIGEALGDHGVELFPVSGRDLVTSCSCPDWANPCKHVAAVHYVVAAALDSDPFLIFVLRGLDRQGLLGALAEARGMSAPADQGREEPPAPEPLWEEPEEMDEELFLGKGRPLAQLAFSVKPAAVDLAGLARLGPPPPALRGLPKRLGAGIRGAARAALALAGSGDSPSKGRAAASDESIRDRVTDFIQSRPDGATMMLLRSRLPDGKEALHRVVHGMKKQGLLNSTGRGAAIRYSLARAFSVREVEPRQAPSQAKVKGAATRPGRKSDVALAAVGEREQQSKGLLAEQITATLAEAGEPLPMREIALRLGCPVDGRLRKALSTLRSDGAVVMVGRRRGARYAVDDSR